jgi:hypothetical protein
MDLKENSVLIFKNDKKNGETHPDYKGQINVNGQNLDIALWVKEGAKGKFFSGKISEPYHKPAEPPASNQDFTDKEDDTPTDTDGLPF